MLIPWGMLQDSLYVLLRINDEGSQWVIFELSLELEVFSTSLFEFRLGGEFIICVSLGGGENNFSRCIILSFEGSGNSLSSFS